ncbi:hypothetical protein GLYMA_13G354150v4 [Glycine max]|nr:hypothetical protein GLYMA_13G354150v4 [Glycine max]KAH1105044.1 hypothetical protein GYH30_038374 [Glycine max]
MGSTFRLWCFNLLLGRKRGCSLSLYMVITCLKGTDCCVPYEK